MDQKLTLAMKTSESQPWDTQEVTVRSEQDLGAPRGSSLPEPTLCPQPIRTLGLRSLDSASGSCPALRDSAPSLEKRTTSMPCPLRLQDEAGRLGCRGIGSLRARGRPGAPGPTPESGRLFLKGCLRFFSSPALLSDVTPTPRGAEHTIYNMYEYTSVLSSTLRHPKRE